MSPFDQVLYVLLKGPLSNLWPLVLLPLVAGLLSDRAARLLPPTRCDWRVAALLAAAPGAVMLVLAAEVIFDTVTHPAHPMAPGDPRWPHAVKYEVTACVAAFLLARAALRSWRRFHALRQVVRLSLPASGRLARAARRAGVETRLLPCGEPECFVAGILHPIVYVSSGALARLSDQELHAALLHERAHIRGRDTRLLTLLSLLHDLAPGGRRALSAYQQARERSADAAAVVHAGAIPVASALLALARGTPRPLPAVGIAGQAPTAWRIRAILEPDGAISVTAAARLVPPAAALLAFTFSAWPLAHDYIIWNICNCSL